MTFDFLPELLEYLADLPMHLEDLFSESGIWPYVVIWFALYLETAIFFMGWLPSNALLMGASAMAAVSDSVSIIPLIFVFLTAAFLGDTTDFFVGRLLGKKYKNQERIRFINQEQFQDAQHFLVSRGRKGLLLSRFVPVLRSIMPLVSGFFGGRYRAFWPFLLGGVIFSSMAYTGIGYFFGNLPSVQENFTLVLTLIMVITTVPAIIVFLRGMIKYFPLTKKPAKKEPPEEEIPGEPLDES